MTSHRCRQCGWHLGSEAEACPKCGTKPTAPNRWNARICTAIFGLIVITSFSGVFSGSPTPAAAAGPASTASPAAKPTPAPIQTASAAAKPVAGTQWTYEHDTDPMVKGEIREAFVRSSNTQNFGFPYAGEQHATLRLRTHPRYGKDIIFSIEKGQFMCRSYRECVVLVKFDDNPPEKFAGVGPEDSSTEFAFLKNYTGFLAKMRKAKKILISTPVYRHGEPIFEFDVTGFDSTKLEQQT